MTGTLLLNVSVSNQSENKSNSTICPDLNDWWEIVYYTVPKYSDTICVIGMLGNVFVLFTYSLHKGPLKAAEIFLMNLAVADLMHASHASLSGRRTSEMNLTGRLEISFVAA